MPTYEYRCKDCDHQFDIQQSFADDALTTCPVCAGTLKKVFGNVGITFKGSGFYKTDSRSGSGTSSSSDKGSSDKGSSDKSASSEKSSSSSEKASSSSDKGSSSGSAPEKASSSSSTAPAAAAS